MKGRYRTADIGLLSSVAEREGFEPSVEVSPNTRLAGERLQPTRPSLRFLAIGYQRSAFSYT
jgi:hypothetical protein